MRKDELTSEELFLKEGDNSAKLPLVDVHDSVMQAIGLGNGHLAVKPVPHQQEGTSQILCIEWSQKPMPNDTVSACGAGL